MRNVILAACLLMVCGCGTPEERATIQANHLQNILTTNTYPIEFKGHQYYYYGLGNSTAVWHDPDCKTCKAKQ